jgi:copper chaperone CopZ
MVEAKTAPLVIRLSLEGVSCNGCVNKIRSVLQASDPDAGIDVDLDSMIAEVSTRLPREQVVQALRGWVIKPTQ